MRTTIHPHNEALQLIDGKMKRLVQTLEHMQKFNPQMQNHRISQSEYNEIKTRLKQLEQSKNLLIDAGELTPPNWENEMVRILDNRENKGGVKGKRIPVVVHDFKGNLIGEYNSLLECSNELEIPLSAVSYCLRGMIRTTTQGYRIKRKENEEKDK